MRFHVIKISSNLVNRFQKDFFSKYSVFHTLNVKNQIEDRRKRAILGGGDKRIEAQHRKVSHLM